MFSVIFSKHFSVENVKFVWDYFHRQYFTAAGWCVGSTQNNCLFIIIMRNVSVSAKTILEFILSSVFSQDLLTLGNIKSSTTLIH